MKIVTCFSYKGGAARTTTAANIAAALASARPGGGIRQPIGRKVAILDLDVFSAGTHRVFGISNRQIERFSQENPCIQDYLCKQIAPSDYACQNGITLDRAGSNSSLFNVFRDTYYAGDACHPGFTLFPARPDPETRFVVQKQHENLLLQLLDELESRTDPAFDYAILDGESGTRQMADIALRLADIILVFFRLTWQHAEGTLNSVRKWRTNPSYKPVYLIPTCVPLVGMADKVYWPEAAGLTDLRRLTQSVPLDSGIIDFARESRKDVGEFWTDITGSANGACVHESLLLKGEERIIVFEELQQRDQAADDFYRIAAELDQICHRST